MCMRNGKVGAGFSYHIRASRYAVGLVPIGVVGSGRVQPRMQTVAGGGQRVSD